MRKLVSILLLACAVVPLYAQRIMHTSVNKKHGYMPGFSFVHLTDIHVGEHIDDYGTPGYRGDTMPAGDVGYAAERLRKSVDWINRNAHKYHIRFVIVTGDLTDSGEKSEFDKANEILSSLTVPFVPQIGNHDVVSHTATEKESAATGDSLCNAVFHAEFDSLKHMASEWQDGYRQVRVYSPYSRHEQFFQNFSFWYDGYKFIFFDLSPRFIYGRPKGEHGPKPHLNDFPHASFEWLMNAVKEDTVDDHNIILCSHQPPHHDFMSIFNGLTTSDYKKLTTALQPYDHHLALWLAGHVHRNKAYRVRTLGTAKPVIRARETASNKEHRNGLLRVVTVYNRGK